jgi:putative NADPH-quinone reductase
VKEKRILLLFAHPAYHKSRVNRHLLAAAQQVEVVHIHDLYEEYPNFHIDVPREQNLLLEHDVVVFQHPFYWYSCPALLKEWLDLVLQHGFAYGDEATALHGKYLLTATTFSPKHWPTAPPRGKTTNRATACSTSSTTAPPSITDRNRAAPAPKLLRR